MAPRDSENNAYAKFWGDKERALWYVMVFLEWSIVAIQQLVCLANVGIKPELYAGSFYLLKT